jgi:hypothetical protein
MLDFLRRKQKCVKEIEIAEEARQILNSPMVQDFFKKAEDAIVEKWKSAPDDAIDARERLFVLHGMLNKFKGHFNTFIINGQFAEKQLDAIIQEESQKH